MNKQTKRILLKNLNKIAIDLVTTFQGLSLLRVSELKKAFILQMAIVELNKIIKDIKSK